VKDLIGQVIEKHPKTCSVISSLDFGILKSRFRAFDKFA